MSEDLKMILNIIKEVEKDFVQLVLKYKLILVKKYAIYVKKDRQIGR